MKKIIKKLRNGFIYVYSSIMALTIMTTTAYADQFADAAEQGANGIHTSAVGILKSLLVIAFVICGLGFAFGSARQKDTVKEKLPEIIIGVATVVGAVPLAGIVFGWFS